MIYNHLQILKLINTTLLLVYRCFVHRLHEKLHPGLRKN
jgi:hypothetical protein